MERLETDDGPNGSGDRPEKDVNKAEYYISQLNSNNAKKVALCLVLGFIFYHGLIHLRYGEYKIAGKMLKNRFFRFSIFTGMPEYFLGKIYFKWLFLRFHQIFIKTKILINFLFYFCQRII